MTDNTDKAAQVAKKKKEAKQRKAARRNARIKATIARLLRSMYSFGTMAMCLFAFVASISMVVGYQWAHNTEKTSAQWNSISVLGQNCTCDNLHESYCAESSDAFQGTSYLSLAVLLCEFLVGIVLTWELASYGVYGGTHDTTRLCLLFSLIAMATEMLSLVAFYSAFSGKHCGDPSFQDQGFSIGWAFYYRAVELFFMVLYVLFTLRSFQTSTRGPPSGALLMIVVLMGLTGVSTQAHGWMNSQDSAKSYSTWESCSCSSLSCSSGTITGTLVLLIFQALFSVIASFFSALRAVDNEGLTVKYNLVFTSLAFLCGLILIILFSITVGDNLCDTGLNYAFEWTWNLEIAVIVGLAIGIVLNAIYLKPSKLIVGGREITTQEAQNSAASNGTMQKTGKDSPTGEEAAAGTSDQAPLTDVQQEAVTQLPKILLYHTMWWFELKDPRTVSHERREGDESDIDSDSDDEVDGSPEGTRKEPFGASGSTGGAKSAWSAENTGAAAQAE